MVSFTGGVHVSSMSDWIQIAEAFANKWNIASCVGSIDGKNVVIKSPGSSGSLYFNYKKKHFL